MKHYGEENSVLTNAEKLQYRYMALSHVERFVYYRLKSAINKKSEILDDAAYSELKDSNRDIALEECEIQINTYRDIMKYLENFR